VAAACGAEGGALDGPRGAASQGEALGVYAAALEGRAWAIVRLYAALLRAAELLAELRCEPPAIKSGQEGHLNFLAGPDKRTEALLDQAPGAEACVGELVAASMRSAYPRPGGARGGAAGLRGPGPVRRRARVRPGRLAREWGGRRH
jgi:hypothetical protein